MLQIIPYPACDVTRRLRRSPWRRPRGLAAAAAMTLLSSVSASAFCGLQSCPRPAGAGEVPVVEAALRTRSVSYDVSGHQGSYIVTSPRLFVNYGRVAVGAEVPFTRLENGGTIVTGLSNPVAMARYARRLSYAWSGEVGLQWELPVGNRKDGLAGDHHMLLPWVGLRHDVMPAPGAASSWYVTGMFGLSTALEGRAASPASSGSQDPAHRQPAHRGQRGEGAEPLAKAAHAGHDHGPEGTPVLVNPHSDREAQGRVAIGWTRGRGTVEGFGLAQYDLLDPDDGARTYARAGLSWEWALMRFTSLQVIADIPVTSARRNERELGLSFKTGF